MIIKTHSLTWIYYWFLGKELEYKTYEDWYKISQEDIIEHGGRTLVSTYYSGSPASLVSCVYPEFDWKVWRFSRVPDGFWDDFQNQIQFMDWLGKR